MLDIGIIGCGYWGPKLLRNFRMLNSCRVTKVYDSSDARSKDMASPYPEIEIGTDCEDLISDPAIAAIAIATPAHTHFDLAKRCLTSGKHVLIEKPMASSVRECTELIELAERQSLTLLVDHTFIYSQPVETIKRTIDSGDLGDISCITSRRMNLGRFQNDINVAWDLAPHDLSIILYILDDLPISVNCQGTIHLNGTTEDIITMSLNFSNGTHAVIQNSWLDPNKVREMTFVGSKKMCVYDDVEPVTKVTIYDTHVEMTKRDTDSHSYSYSYHRGDIYCPHLQQVEPLSVECQHFLDCIVKGTEPKTGGFSGLQVVRILEGATTSLNNGGGAVQLRNGQGRNRQKRAIASSW